MFKFFFLAACVAVCAAVPKPKADVTIPVATYPAYPAIPAYPAYPAAPIYTEGGSPAYSVVPSVGVAAVPISVSSHHSSVVHSAPPTTYSAYPAVSAYSAFPATYPAVKTYSTEFTHF